MKSINITNSMPDLPNENILGYLDTQLNLLSDSQLIALIDEAKHRSLMVNEIAMQQYTMVGSKKWYIGKINDYDGPYSVREIVLKFNNKEVDLKTKVYFADSHIPIDLRNANILPIELLEDNSITKDNSLLLITITSWLCALSILIGFMLRNYTSLDPDFKYAYIIIPISLIAFLLDYFVLKYYDRLEGRLKIWMILLPPIYLYVRIKLIGKGKVQLVIYCITLFYALINM